MVIQKCPQYQINEEERKVVIIEGTKWFSKSALMITGTVVGMFLIVCAVFIIFIAAITLWWVYDTDRSIIENGLSAKLMEMLEDEYQLTIPEDAVFVDGRYSYPQESTFLLINFKVKKDDQTQTGKVSLGSRWSSSTYPEESDGFADVGEGHYTFSGTAFPREPFLTCENKDGWLCFYFHGFNPPKKILYYPITSDITRKELSTKIRQF